MLVFTVDRTCKNTGNGRLARSARSAEKITVSDPPGYDLIFQCAYDRVASPDIIEVSGTVFSI